MLRELRTSHLLGLRLIPENRFLHAALLVVEEGVQLVGEVVDPLLLKEDLVGGMFQRLFDIRESIKL